MKKIFTHTGIITDTSGDRQVKMYATPLSWVVSKTQCYHKNSGLRVGGRGPRLNLGSIKEIGVKEHENRD